MNDSNDEKELEYKQIKRAMLNKALTNDLELLKKHQSDIKTYLASIGYDLMLYIFRCIKKDELASMSADEQITNLKKLSEAVKNTIDKNPDVAIQINQNIISKEEAERYLDNSRETD